MLLCSWNNSITEDPAASKRSFFLSSRHSLDRGVIGIGFVNNSAVGLRKLIRFLHICYVTEKQINDLFDTLLVAWFHAHVHCFQTLMTLQDFRDL